MPSSLIRYLRDCFVEDHRRTAVLDVFARSVSHRLFVEDREEVLTGVMSRVPVDDDQTADLRQAAQLYQRERELLYGSLFIVGSIELSEPHEPAEESIRPSGPTSICAPILLYPARFVEEPPFLFVEPDLAELRLNDGLLDALAGSEEAIDLAQAIEEFARSEALEFYEIGEIGDLLERAVTKLSAHHLRDYPKLLDGGQVVRIQRESVPGGVVRVVPASAVLLVPRSRAARGVASELTHMAEASVHSPPVRALLGEVMDLGAPRAMGHVPAVLSAAQLSILDSAARRPASLAIGPPGTGKSFTIAAMALEHVGRGETVIVASRMDHAVDVVANKIEYDLGIDGCVMRGGRHGTRRQLANYVRELLAGIHTANAPDHVVLQRDRLRLERLARRIDSLERQAERLAEREIGWSRSVATTSATTRERVRERWSLWRAGRTRPLCTLVSELDRARDEYIALAQRNLRDVNARRLADALKQHRRQIQRLDRALRARTSGRQANLFAEIDIDVLLATFPIWLVTMADVADILPLHPEMFDLAVVDEATQCDAASALPVLQRARRAAVVGDPHQLRHISFLATSRQQALAERHSLRSDLAAVFDYRNHSLLDVFDAQIRSQDGVAFLDEHYRSVPPIIEFSSQRFYAGKLRLMTEQPGQLRRPALVLHEVAGERDANGVNRAEVDRLVAEVRRVIDDEAALPQSSTHSIGVLSPFRSQIDAIAEALSGVMDTRTMERHRLMVGTAHTFQGEERDLMFLSFALDDAAHPAALRFLERPDVFNVAITRARTTQHVFSSVDAGGLRQDSLLRAYLSHVRHHHGSNGGPTGRLTPSDAFADDVAGALMERGLRVDIGFPVAGLVLDLAAHADGRACGIDLLGYTGHFEQAIPLERYRMLARAGMPMVPISYVRWQLDKRGCVERVLGAIGAPPSTL